MSTYETAEQRQIRELRQQLNTANSQMSIQSAENRNLRQQMENIRRQQEVVNNQIQQRITAQNEAMAKERQAHQQASAKMSSTIQQLDREVKEKERIHNERIQNLQTKYNQQIIAMNTQFQNERQHLREDIQQVRSDNQQTRQALLRTQQEMRDSFVEVRRETDRKLNDQKNALRREISNVSSKLQGQISAVEAQVQSLTNQILKEKTNAKELAEYWIQEAERLIREIENTYREAIIDPRRLDEIRQKLENAKQDVSTGQPAIVPAREAFQDAMRMKEDLAELDMEWNYWYNVLCNNEAKLYEDLESANSRVYEFTSEDGKTWNYLQGIDYWTNGQLSIVKERVEKLRGRIGDVERATIEDLKQYGEEARSLIEELSLVENASHINVAMSLSRYQTAVKIGEILGDEYEMIESDGDFFATENNEEYHATFVNPLTGDAVVVVITPVPDEAGVVANHIELIATNGMDNNDLNRVHIHDIVSRKLKDKGIPGMNLGNCADRHGDRIQEVIETAGNIQDVADGKECVRVGVPQRENNVSNETAQIQRRSAKKVQVD